MLYSIDMVYSEMVLHVLHACYVHVGLNNDHFLYIVDVNANEQYFGRRK